METHSRPPLRAFAVGTVSLISVALLAALIYLAASPAPAPAAPAAPAQPAQAFLIEVVAAPASILPGSVGDFLFRITNNSGANRVFTLTVNTNSGVTAIFPEGSQVTVVNGGSAEFSVTTLVSMDAIPGSLFTQIMQTSSSSPSPLLLSTSFDVLVGSPGPIPTIYPSPTNPFKMISSPGAILPGRIGDFRFRISYNSGLGDTRTFTLSASTSGGVVFTFPQGNLVQVADGSSVEFTVGALLPSNAAQNSVLAQILRASSSSPTPLEYAAIFSVQVGGPIPTSTPPYKIRLPVVERSDSALGTPTAAISGSPLPTTTPWVTTTAYVPITPAPANIKINDVVCRDPKFPDDSEFIELRNNGAASANLAGWSITNTSRSNISYTFPSFTINGGPDVYVAVYSGIGTDRPDPVSGEFYWGRTDQLWLVGEKAELRDSSGSLIDSYVVLASSC